MQDVRWLLASLPAAAVALWRAGARAEETAAETGEVSVPQQGATPAPAVEPSVVEVPVEGPAVAAAVLAARQAAAEQSAPGAAAALQVTEAAAEAAQVQGAADLIDALVRSGIVTRAEAEETGLVGVIRPDGPGWTATVELPQGRTAEQAVSKAGELASALRVKSSQVQLGKDTSAEGHEGRFVIWVATGNPYGGAPTPSELLAADSWDFWASGVPLGVNARGVRRILNMLWSSMLIGGLMGYGKSYLARLIAAAAVLDPYVDIVLLSGKSGADWAALKLVADTYITGNSNAVIREMHGAMEDLVAEMARHGEVLEELFETDPRSCPEGKITPELARRDDLHITLLIVDELQEILDAANGLKLINSEEAAEAEASERKVAGQNGKSVMVSLFARFMRVARFVGGIAVIITQRPDSNSVPTELREVAAKRASFRVKGAHSARMVLGDDAVASGAAPHLLLEAHKGVAVIDEGAEEGHDTIRADVIDLDQFRVLCERGRHLRVQAGTLTGQAARRWEQEGVLTERKLLLDAVRHAFESRGEDRARVADLATWLAEDAPDAYGDLTETALAARLREAGAGTTTKIGRVGEIANASGYTLDAIVQARRTVRAA